MPIAAVFGESNICMVTQQIIKQKFNCSQFVMNVMELANMSIMIASHAAHQLENVWFVITPVLKSSLMTMKLNLMDTNFKNY